MVEKFMNLLNNAKPLTKIPESWSKFNTKEPTPYVIIARYIRTFSERIIICVYREQARVGIAVRVLCTVFMLLDFYEENLSVAFF